MRNAFFDSRWLGKARGWRMGLSLVMFTGLLLAGGALLLTPPPAQGLSSDVVISQVYGGAGCGTVNCSTYKNDYIELFNRGASAVSLNGWSVQYASAAGSSWTVTNLTNVMLQPGQYYLVQEAFNNNGTNALPPADASGSIAMSATAGKVALVTSTTALSVACPSGVKDFIGYGTGTNCNETAAAPAPSTTTADLRGLNGCTETDNNSTDFSAGAPNPRNTSTAFNVCGGGGNTLTLSCTPTTFAETAGPGASTCTVTRSGSTAAALTVTLMSSDTTEATVPASVNIPISSTSANFAVAAVDDLLIDGPLSVTITAMSAGFSDGTAILTVTDNEVAKINQIQGSGTTSPFVGIQVTTQGIVTGVKSNGFFIQEPDATVDLDPNTSEGVFVFFTSTPLPAAAAVGNLVQVVGTVAEFTPGADPQQPPLTELTAPSVTLLSASNPLPAPIALTSSFPSAAGAFNQLERVEGMRVSVASLTVTAPTQGFLTETSATSTSSGVFLGAITGVARPFREPGIQQPDTVPSGTIPPIPRWDSNPELLRVDSDGQTGAAAIDVATGAVVTGLVGPLDYSTRAYTILPDPATPPGVSGGLTPTPLAAPTATQYTIGSLNLERFYDTVDDAGTSDVVLTATAYNNRLNKASLAIRNILRTPDILGVVEMEKLSVLTTLANKINSDAVAASQPNPNYVAYLVEGNDAGGIDVGFLVKTAIVTGATPRVNVLEVTQFGLTATYLDPNTNTQALLNDRPPLLLRATVSSAAGASATVTVIINHLRSLNGVDDAADGARVRAKRQAQAEYLANLVQARQTATPSERIVLAGDFNAFELNDGYVDSMNVIRGVPTPDNQTVVPGDGVDLVTPDLINLHSTLSASQRYTYTFGGNAQALDHILISANLSATFNSLGIGHFDADFPETDRNNNATPNRISDHDGLVAYFNLTSPTITISQQPPATLNFCAPGRVYLGFTATGAGGLNYQWRKGGVNLVNGGNLDGVDTNQLAINNVQASDSGSYDCVITDSNGSQLTTATALTIGTPPTISPTTLGDGMLGQAYSQLLSPVGGTGPFSFTIKGGALPSGMTLSEGGLLGGIPASSGAHNFTVRMLDAAGCGAFQNYTLNISGMGGCPIISIPTPPIILFNQPYSFDFGPGTTPADTYTYTDSGGLPAGISRTGSVLSGTTMATVGNYPVTFTATNPANCVGSRLIALKVRTPSVALAMQADYDGDGKADLPVWSPETGEWLLRDSRSDTLRTVTWGQKGDLPVLGDYDDDGKTDIAVFRPGNGVWYIRKSSNGGLLTKAWGLGTDVPVPGDFDGDGITDIAVWRGEEGNWYILQSSDGKARVEAWGAAYAPYNDVPLAGDYDGDGKSDLAVFRRGPTGGAAAWYVKQSRTGQFKVVAWGLATDTPVPGDYDGDGRTDIAVWRGGTGTWYVLESRTNQPRAQDWGAAYAPYHDVPAGYDYDGDGQADLGVYRPVERTWYVLESRSGQPRVQAHGSTGATPVKR